MEGKRTRLEPSCALAVLQHGSALLTNLGCSSDLWNNIERYNIVQNKFCKMQLQIVFLCVHTRVPEIDLAATSWLFLCSLPPWHQKAGDGRERTGGAQVIVQETQPIERRRRFRVSGRGHKQTTCAIECHFCFLTNMEQRVSRSIFINFVVRVGRGPSDLSMVPWLLCCCCWFCRGAPLPSQTTDGWTDGERRFPSSPLLFLPLSDENCRAHSYSVAVGAPQGVSAGLVLGAAPVVLEGKK